VKEFSNPEDATKALKVAKAQTAVCIEPKARARCLHLRCGHSRRRISCALADAFLAPLV